MSEYTVLLAFAAGILAQALQVARSWRDRAGVLVLAVLATAGAWAGVGKSPDWRFELPAMASCFFLFGFAAFFRDQILPRISVRALLHLTLPVYFLLAQQVAPLQPRPDLMMILSAPLVWLLWLALRRPAPGRANRLLMYIWYLLVLIWLVPLQWSGTQLAAIFRETGFSWMLLAYSFTMGGVALYFCAHALYLLILIPVPRRRHILERLLEGPNDPADDFARDHARALIAKVETRRTRTLRAYLLIALHAALLLLDYLFNVVGRILAVNVSVLLVSWLLLSPRAAGSGLMRPGARSAAPGPMDTREAC